MIHMYQINKSCCTTLGAERRCLACVNVLKLLATFLTRASGLNWTDNGSFFQLAGGAVLAVGVWTLVEKSEYISLLNSSFYSASAYILIAAGLVVIVTGIIGCCATLNEMKSLLIVVRWFTHIKHYPSLQSTVRH